MKELLDLLARRERKILVLLCALLIVGLLFYEVFALRQKSSYSFAVESLPAQQKEYEQIKESSKDIIGMAAVG